jgi:cytochrome P450
MTDTGDAYWDPYSIELDDDPHPAWRQLRDEFPVYRNDAYDFWALSRFADVDAASRDTEVFSSAHGTVLESMSAEVTSSGMRVKELEGPIRTICRALLAPHANSRGFDFVTDFAAQLPSRVISSLVGVPPEDQEEQRRNVDGMFHIEPGVGMANDRAMESALALAVYLAHLAETRSTEPRDDLMSDLVAAEVIGDDGTLRRLNPDECVRFAILLYAAGTETVAKLLGNAAVILAGHPGQRGELASDPSLVPNAVEELLRYEAPSPVNGRWTTRSVTLHGVTIPADSKILLLTGSAGRDDRVFPEPDVFDIHREITHHVSFGYGIHFCIGAALARMEGRIALEETLASFPEWDVNQAGLIRAHTSTVRGYSSVPVTL